MPLARQSPPRLIQLRYTTADRFVLATDDSHLLRVVRALLSVVGATIIGFGIADNHVHILVDVTGVDPVRAVQVVTHTLTRRGGQVLSPTWWEPVRDQHHLRNIVMYQLRQPSHHGIGVPNALWAGSTRYDLIGARRCGSFAPERLFAHLPRLRANDILDELGVPALRPLSPDDLARCGPAAIAEAAARAIARPTLAGSTHDVLAARRAAVALVRKSNMPTAGAKPFLGAPPRTLRRDVRRDPDEQMLAAVCKQLALHRAVQQQALARLASG